MLEIQRNNKVLMEKLIDISKGKQSILSAAQSKHSVKSMHKDKKIQKQGDIERENIKLMMRIVKQKPQISRSKLNVDYEGKLKYKAMISKTNRATLEKAYMQLLDLERQRRI